MAQYIKQGDIFGRIGSGFGKGLAEQVPKEIERNRLSSGLKAFEQEHQNLNPMQQLARLSAIPGITPQTIQSFSDLAKTNNMANAYRNVAGGYGRGNQGQPPESSADITPVQERQFLDNIARPMQQGTIRGQPQGRVPDQQAMGGGRFSSREPEQPLSSPNENTFNPAAKTSLPWPLQQRDARILHYIDKGFLPDQSQRMAADDEARELGVAPVLQQRQREDMERTTTAKNELERHLETKFQKTKEGIYKDLPGEFKINLERAMQKALRTNPNLSIEDAAHEFSKKALATAKARNQFDKTAKTTGLEAFAKKQETLSKLNDYSGTFKDSGNSEEYYNILKKEPVDGGMGLSSEGAATVAFPISPSWNNYVNNFKPQNFKQTKYGEVPDPKRSEANSRKAAIDIGKMLTEDDSLLTIARALRQKDPYFDQEAFFDEIKQNMKTLNLNDRQRLEIPERNTDWLPTWGDMRIFNWFSR
jgi:hypothetical protein